MRSFVVSISLAILLVCAACHPRGKVNPTGERRLCPSTPTSNGYGVTLEKEGNHCKATFDVADSKLNDSYHPEIELAEGDVMVFTHSNGKNFHYDIDPNPPDNVDEGECWELPTPLDTGHLSPATEHRPGALKRNHQGPDTCHYKLSFVIDDSKTTAEIIDPHIAVGR